MNKYVSFGATGVAVEVAAVHVVEDETGVALVARTKRAVEKMVEIGKCILTAEDALGGARLRLCVDAGVGWQVERLQS